ncbi:Calx-beta domain-containing protein [Candidatus Neomarinimicrobiota bacterium]
MDRRLFKSIFVAGIVMSANLYGQLVGFDAATDSQAEDAGGIAVNVTATGALSVDVAVSGSAILNTDYTLSTSTLTFFGAGTQSVTVTITDDALYESSETVQLTLTNVSVGGYDANRDHVLTITNNDAAPTIQFQAASGSGSEGSNGTLTVSLSPVSGLNASVDYSVTGGTATGGGTDFTLASGTVTVFAGATTANITVNVVNDLLDEFDETVIVSISNPSNAQPVIPVSAHTYTISDNDNPPTIAFVTSSNSADESVTPATAQLTLDALSGKDVTVNYATTGTATGGGTDYTLAAGPATVTAGQLTADIAITVIDDDLDENDETVILTISSPTQATLGTTTTHTYTIQDEDDTPTISFNSATDNGLENAGSVNIQVDLSAVSGRTATVDYAVTGGLATGSGTDYTLTSGTVTFIAGSASENISLSLNDDALDEAGETVEITLSNPSNADPGAEMVHTYTINDNDGPPAIQFANTTSSGSEGAGTINLPLTLSVVSGQNVTVNYSVTAGSATSGLDYTLNAGTATIAAGGTTTNITATIINDILHEAIETLDVTIANPGSATLGANTVHTLSLTDNDAAPLVQFTSAAASGDEGTAAPTYEISISAVSGLDVTVDYSAAGGTATGSGTDYTLASGTATISAGNLSTNITTMNIVDDALDENNETLVITLSNESEATLTGNTSFTYTITDNDATPTVGFTTTSATGSENVTPVTFTIAPSAVSGLDITVDYAITGTATGGGIDYVMVGGTASIPAGNASVQLSATITDDIIDENSETLILTLSSPSNATLGTNIVHTYTLTDNDAPPTIAFTATTSTKSEASSPANIEVRLSVVSGLTASVDYVVSGGTTASGSGVDYTLAGGTATIAAGQTTVNIPVALVNDPYDEPDEIIEVTISNPTNSTLGANTVHTMTLTDDDLAPVIQFDILASSGLEATTPGSLLVTISGISQFDITVDYTVTGGGTATLGPTADFVLAAGTVNIDAGDSTGYITPVIVDDGIVESDETIEVTLTAASSTNSTIGGNTVHTYTIINDDAPPVAFTVGTVVATGDSVVTDYWNGDNTGLDVTVPVDDSNPLIGGTIQVKAIVGTDTTNLGGAISIGVGDLGNDVVASFSAAQLEAITGFAEGADVSVTALISDAVGNKTTGTASTNVIKVDQVPPADLTLGAVVSSGGTAVAGYWNGTNSALNLTVPIANDASLVSGVIQLQAEADGSFEAFGAPRTIIAANVTTGSVTISVDSAAVGATGVEELNGYNEGDILTFRALLTDVASNARTSSVSATQLIVDETTPTLALTYSDTLANQGDVIIVTGTFSEDMTASPRITLAYTTNTVANVAMTGTADSSIWTYSATIPAQNTGTVTTTVTGTDLAGNALAAVDVTGGTNLEIDNAPPGYVVAYNDSLVKEGESIAITVTFDESVAPGPTITVNFAGTGFDSTDVALSQGSSDSVWTYLIDTPTGNDGYVTITVDGTDLVGNAAVAISGATNTLLVDNTSPSITVTAPADNSFRRVTDVAYTLSETVDSASFKWTPTSTDVVDSRPAQVIELSTTELTVNNHAGALTNFTSLVQGVDYRIDFMIYDAAGNGDTATVVKVAYDTLAPVITSGFINDSLATTDVDSTQANTIFTGRWGRISDAVSAIQFYEYAIGTSKGDTNIVGWTSNSTDTTIQVTGLSLAPKGWYFYMVRAADMAGNVSDSLVSDGVRVISKAALTAAVLQNSAILSYLDIFVSDSIGMINTLTLTAGGTALTPTKIDSFTWAASHKLTAAGAVAVVATSSSAAGDTSVTNTLTAALAKRNADWLATSHDGQFRVQGAPGSMTQDGFLSVIDASLLPDHGADGALYQLAVNAVEFGKPVKVSMLSRAGGLAKGEARAIYQLNKEGTWEELPTVDEDRTVVAWANQGGQFKIGKRTIVLPRRTSLSQNYPNPFNPSTRILFDLGYEDGPEQQASLVIYNILGQEVVTLHNSVSAPGRYELLWNSIDRRGMQVASGVYFVRLTTGTGRNMIKKMLLVR